MPIVQSLQDMFQVQSAPGDDLEFLRLVTEADLRLLEMGRWRWTRGRVTLTPVSSLVTLPADYASILAARLDAYPLDIRDEEYEFVPDGIGEVEVGGAGGVRLIDQGLDGSGGRVYKLTGVTDDTKLVYALCHYAPYTLYFSEELPASPALTESTTTRCPSAGALKLMCLGIIFEEAHDMGSSAHYVATAIRNLNDRGQARRGGAKQSVNVRLYGPGVSGIRSFY